MPNEFLEDLLMAAQEVVDFSPDLEYETWVDILMKRYPTEVVDALGSDPLKIESGLKEIWKTHLKATQSH